MYLLRLACGCSLLMSIVESRDVPLLRHMYYPRLDAGVTGLDPLVVIETNFPRDEVVEPH